MNKTETVIKIVEMMKNISMTAISTILNQGYGVHVVFATEGVTGLPDEWVNKPMVPLNFNPESYANYSETDDYIMFDTRFNGKPHSLTMYKKSIVQIRALSNITKNQEYVIVPIQCIGVHEESLMKELEMYISDTSKSLNTTNASELTTAQILDNLLDPNTDDRPPRAIPGVPHLRRIK